MVKQSSVHICISMQPVVIHYPNDFDGMWTYLAAPSDGTGPWFSEVSCKYACVWLLWWLNLCLLQWSRTTSLWRQARNMTPAPTAACTSSSWVPRKCRQRGCGWISQKEKTSLQMAPWRNSLFGALMLERSKKWRYFVGRHWRCMKCVAK